MFNRSKFLCLKCKVLISPRYCWEYDNCQPRICSCGKKLNEVPDSFRIPPKRNKKAWIILEKIMDE